MAHDFLKHVKFREPIDINTVDNDTRTHISTHIMRKECHHWSYLNLIYCNIVKWVIDRTMIKARGTPDSRPTLVVPKIDIYFLLRRKFVRNLYMCYLNLTMIDFCHLDFFLFFSIQTQTHSWILISKWNNRRVVKSIKLSRGSSFASFVESLGVHSFIKV